MKILNMYATFGKLNEKHLSLSEGMNVIYGANESGKSTWSAFIRVMFYGISTREQSKIGHLADKEKYAPWSGAPMYGKIEFLWQNKRYILERTANRAGILQKAKIFEADTGIEIDIPEPVGETLLGVRREVFERTAFIAQSQIAVSADKTGELEKKIVALATTGEADFSQTQIIESLEKQRRKIKNYKKGELPDIEEELNTTREKLSRAREEAQQLSVQSVELERISSEEQKISRSIESLRIRDAKRILAYIESCERERDECAINIEELKKEEKITASQCEQIEEKLKQFKEKREDYTNCIEKLQVEQNKLSNLTQVKINKNLPLVWSIVCAAVLGGISAVFLKWFFAVLTAAVAFVITYFTVKSTYLKKNGVKSFDELSAKNDDYMRTAHYVDLLSAEKETAEIAKNRAESELKSVLSMVGAKISEADELISSSKKLEADINEAKIALNNLTEKTAAAKRERDIDALKALAANEEKFCEYPDLSIEEISAKAENLKAEKQRRGELIAALKQKIAMNGSLGALENKISELEEELIKKQKQYNALTLAIDTFSEIQTELQSRFAPEVSKRAGEIFAELTGGHFSIVQIKDAEMNLSVAEGNTTPPRGILELSGGTLDELYLAVRLALCEQLLSNDVPIVLDDVFVNFDDERMKNAINLLKSKKNQVIIFTCHTREITEAKEKGHFHTSI